jgi:hypothetical protein
MTRRRKDPLRALTDEECMALSQLSRSHGAPAAQVARATALLAIADGHSYTAAARRVGRRHGDTVAAWPARFNRDGLAAVVPRPAEAERPRSLREWSRPRRLEVDLTLFPPATGQVRVQPAANGTNAVLHSWLKTALAEIVAALPLVAEPVDATTIRATWQVWQEGLAVRFTLPEQPPPLRLLLVWDNLAGHKTPEMVLWLCQHGIMPLYTPLGGSWLNMAEAIQRILKRRTLDGQQPQSPEEIGTWFEQTAQHWNRQPTPFVWRGKRRQRRRRAAEGRHRLGGAAACTYRPLRRMR